MKMMNWLLAALLMVGFSTVSLAEISQEEIATGVYLPAAESGEPYAQLALGEMYYKGEEISRDLVKAYAWLAVSAHQQVYEAEELRDKVLKELPAANRDQAKRLAQQFIANYSRH